MNSGQERSFSMSPLNADEESTSSWKIKSFDHSSMSSLFVYYNCYYLFCHEDSIKESRSIVNMLITLASSQIPDLKE